MNFKKLNRKVNKFTVEWQILRISLKNKSVRERFILIETYFNNERSLDNCIRIINYLEGLKRSLFLKEEVEDKIKYYNEELNNNLKTEKEINILKFENYDFKIKYLLLQDLFYRNKKWLSKGYHHNGQNIFIDKLLENLKKEETAEKEKLMSYTKKLNELRENSSLISNTYSFIY